MKNITELLSEVALRGVVVPSADLVDQDWFREYTRNLLSLASEQCANHVRNMPSRGGFKFAERASYVNQEDAIEIIKSLFTDNERIQPDTQD